MWPWYLAEINIHNKALGSRMNSRSKVEKNHEASTTYKSSGKKKKGRQEGSKGEPGKPSTLLKRQDSSHSANGLPMA